MRERRHRHIHLLGLSNMHCRQMAERILSGRMTLEDGDSSDLARASGADAGRTCRTKQCRRVTSTTTGSTNGGTTGSLSRLKLSKVVPLTIAGQGCLPSGGRSLSGIWSAVTRGGSMTHIPAGKFLATVSQNLCVSNLLG